MANKADVRRRWFGAALLGVPVLLLILGETVLEERLRQHHWLALIFWLSCFGFVFVAILVAVMDLMLVRARLRAEQRGLMKETWDKIAQSQRERSNDPPET